MAFAAPLFNGTLGYIGAMVAAMIILRAGNFLGIFSKDNTGVGMVVIAICFFCMWFLWFMAWMAQWHPLIFPEYPG